MSFFISNAHAAGESAPAGSGIELLIMMGVFFAIMYFMIIRPQSKRTKDHKALIDSLAKGSEVVTSGGLLGKVTALSDNFVTVKLAEGVEVQVQRHAIASIMPKGTMKKS